MPRIATLLVGLAAGCGATGSGWHAPPEPPRLVILVVIDQLPVWTFATKLPRLDAGIARAVAAGRLYTGEYPSAATVTAAGHATLGTGASPSDTGIIANNWYRRELGREVPVADDGAGNVTAAMLRVPGIADAMFADRSRARAVGVSLKPRASLLPLGHTGTAIWYDASRPGWSTLGARPGWLDQLEREHPIKPRLDTVWAIDDLDAMARYTGTDDDLAGELGTHQLGAAFPHRLADTDNPARAIVATPLGNEIILEAAVAAIAGAQLGADHDPDFLSVSFSAHDYVGHAWGMESWEAWDTLRRIDRLLATLLDELDHRVGVGRWAMVLTSDHGVARLPERTGGSRHPYGEIARIAEAAAEATAGPGPWIAVARYPSLHFTPAFFAADEPVRARVQAAVIDALRRQPWLSRVGPRDDLVGDCAARSGDDARLCWALDPARSGEVVFAPRANVVLHEDDEATATEHGSLEPYDYQVPVILIGPGVVPGREVAPVSMLRITPTLTRWLGVEPPPLATAAPLP